MPRPRKHSFTIGGHRTSISLENEFWETLKTISEDGAGPIAQLVHHIDGQRGRRGLSSAVRVWILEHYISKAAGGPGNSMPASAPEPKPTSPAAPPEPTKTQTGVAVSPRPVERVDPGKPSRVRRRPRPA